MGCGGSLMSTLVYIGANVGFSLGALFRDFDKVYAFEPDPEMFEQLSSTYESYKHVTLVNAACTDLNGEATFYITGNRVASSLGDGSKEFKDRHGFNASVIKEIKVKTINLCEYLESEGVEFIDLYFSDAQGSDLTILKTMKSYLDDKKIGELFIETHEDGTFLYDGLDNQFSGFKEILSDNYDFIHASLGAFNGKIVDESGLVPGDPEWDSYWKLKTYEGTYGLNLRA
jgi:FkbM family methyltransferase